MRTFEDLINEAETADISGWDFNWLSSRASEERPPWGYARQLAHRLTLVNSALDLDTGGGEVLSEAQNFPPLMCATEAWPPNVRKARDLLGPRGVDVIEIANHTTFPFKDMTFELVSSRHPVKPDWKEIHRVLKPGGHYFAQHIGPASAFELIEYFLGPLPQERRLRDPNDEVSSAQAAGLTVTNLQTARCQLAFHDIGAIVWILRKCVWWVPDFSVKKYYATLKALDHQMRQGQPFIAHSTRHLIEAQRSYANHDPDVTA